ncbi:MAG: T9SS type A sorting domain-containing protein [Bacteroidia bacterium]|nr:T9SS type A sorting domain-containing protein [Bacteroidia bacterium]
MLDTSEKKILRSLEDNDIKELLEEYADDSTMAGSSLARAVLNTLEDRPMNFQYLLPDESPGERMMGPLTNTETQNTEATEPEGLFTLYPNPAGNSFYIRYSAPNKEQAEISYTLMDVVGKEISEGKLKTNTQIEIDASGLNNGIYFITLVEGEHLIKSQKIVIMK